MNVTLTIVLAEICLVLLAVIAVIAVKAISRFRRERAAVDTLVTSIKTHQSERTEKLAGKLKESGQLSDEDAKGKADDFVKKQNKFYQEAIDLYFARNHEVMSKLDSKLEDLLDQYQVIVSVAEGETPTVDSDKVEQVSKDIAALTKELEALRTENANLISQLKAAENELDQLGREYVSAFNKPKENKPKQDTGEEEEEGEVAEQEPVADEGGADNALENEVETVNEPTADSTVSESEDAEVPVPDQEQPSGELTDEVTTPAGDQEEEEEEDKGMLTDLDLEELIGDQTDNEEKPDEKK